MKPRRIFSAARLSLPLAAALVAMLAVPRARAANWFWDGGTVNLVGTGNATSAGGAGNWNTTLTNWDPSPSGSAYSAWTSIHTANFGGTAGAVAVGAGITANGLTFSAVGYSFTGSAITLAAGSTITSVGNGTQTFTGGLATADNILRFTNSNTTPAFSNGTLFTAVVGISGASTSVQINGASTNSPVVLNGTLSYGGTTTVAANTAFGLSASTITGLANGSISMGANSTLLRTGGNLAQATLDKVATTTNTFTIVANNAGTASTLNLTNFPNASLAVWDNAGTQTFAFTGAITAGSNGYRFGSSRAGNTINIGGTNTTGAVTPNILTGSAGLTFVSGTTGTNPLNLWGANTYSGNTINNVAGRAISINHPLAMQNSAIDTSGAGTYVLGTGSSGTNGNGGAAITTPTLGGLTGSKNLLTNVIATTGYNTMTSLTLNPGTGSTHTYSGVIANSTAGLALSKSGAGTQVLSGLNTFAGNVTVSGGTLAAAVSASGGNSALGSVVSTRTINVNTGGTLRADSSNIFNPTFSTPATSLPALNIAGGTMTNGGPAFNSALGNITLAAGTLTATTGSPIGTGMSGEGWGSWNLNGTVTSTGNSTISSTAPGGIPITLSTTATNSYVTTFDVQSGTLTASAIFGDVTRVGNETVSGLAKTGAGTMVLSGINTYTGNTAINAGALSIATTGALPGYNVNGRYSVAAGATLAVQNGVLDSEITAILGTTNFASGANLGFDTSAGSRSVPLNLANTANGPLGIVKLGANTLTLTGTLSHTGGTSVQAGSLNVPSISSLPGWNVNGGFSIASGASLIIPNSVTESEVTTILGTTNLSSGASLLFDTSAGNRTYASAITNSASGLLNIGKFGANTLTLSGANTYSGGTSVTEGSLTITGSLGGSATTSTLTFGTAAATTGVNVSSGANLTLATLQGANNLSAATVYSQTGGTVIVAAPGSTAESAYAASSGSGYFNLSGGSVTVHSRFTAALNGTGGGKGVARVGGGAGSAALTVGELLAVTRGVGSIGELTVLPNGTTTFDGTGANNMLLLGANASQAALLNIAGGTFSSPVKPIAFGNGTVTNSSIGIINVGAGTLEIGSSLLVNTIASGTNKGFVNFAGGTVKLLANTSGNLLLPASNGGFDSLANTIFGPVSNSAANLDGTGAASAVNGIVGASQNFSGGVNIDTGAFSTTISGPLVAPAGGGVAQGNISITDAGAGYAAPPTVLFSNPAAANRTPAAGYALVNGGLLTGIVITSPGAYDSSDTVTVTLTGGGATTPATVASIPGASLTANTSGGLVKTGSGVLTLSAANTYTGPTAVNAGTLNLTGSLASGINVASNARLLGEGSTTGSLVFGSGSSFLGFDRATPGSLTAGSANATGAVVSLLPTTAPTTATGIVVLAASGGSITGAIGSEFVYTGRGTLSYNVGNTQLLLDTTPASLAWRGNDGTNPTFWDLNTTTNWDSGVPEKFLTGDGALFDDTATSFVVDINAANVFPGNIIFNNSTNYTLQGAFGIYGPGTLTKNGTGTTVINTSNGYTGVTSVNAGVLNIRTATALGDVIAGTTVASGAALEIQGGITTAAEALTLNGSGVSSGGALRNISGNNGWGVPVALASASSIGVDADTLTLPGLTGAFGLTKVGAGTLNITGATAVTSTTVEAGTLYMGAQSGASTTTTLGAANPVTLNGSSSLVIRRTNTGGSDVTGAIGGTGSLTLLGDNATTIGVSDYTLNNASTYSGGTSITGSRAAPTLGSAFGTGTVTVGANGGIFVNAATQTFTNNFVIGGLGWNENSGLLGALRMNGTTVSGDITLTANTRLTGTNTSTLSGVVSGGFDLDFFEDTAIGTITLSGNNTYTGATIVNSMGAAPATMPILTVSNNNALGTTAGGTIVYGTGATSGAGSQLALATGITVTDETLTLDPTAAGYRASLTTAASATATWDGNVVLAGTVGLAGFFTGATSFLTVGSSDADTVTGSNTLVLRGTGTGTVNSTLNLGVRGLIKTDASTWTINSNNNDFTGTSSVANGILSVSTIANSGVNSALGSGTEISFGANSTATGTLQFTGSSGGSSNRPLTIANGTTGGAGAIENTVSGQLLALSGALTVNTPASACSLTLTGAGDGLLSGGIVGTPFLSINKSGAGTWTLSGTTNHTGTTSVTAGTLTLGGTNVVNSATSVGKFTVNGATAVANIAGTYNVANGNGDAFFEIRGGGTVNFSGTASLTGATGAGFRVGEASAGTLNVTAGSLNFVPTATSNLVVGRTSGANGTLNISGGTVTVSGLGGFIIANDATTTGTVTIGGTGTLDISTATFRIGGNAAATAATLNLNTGGTLKLGSALTSVGGTTRTINFDGGMLQSTANIAMGGLPSANVKAGGAKFDTTGGNISVNLALLEDGVSTGGGLTKSGINTLTLTGVNTYTGATLVSNGVLALVGGSQASAITVDNGASLGFTLGSGTTSTNSVTFNTGSTVTITGTTGAPSYTLMTATSFAGITPVLSAPVAGYELKVEGGNTLKLVQLGYGAWASLNGAGVNLDDDHDGDGVSNGVEYFLGGPNGNTTGFTALPGVVNTAGTLSVTWPKGVGYAGAYPADFVVETSATLSGPWTVETIGGGNITDTANPGGSVKYTFPGGPAYTGKNFARLRVTGP